MLGPGFFFSVYGRAMKTHNNKVTADQVMEWEAESLIDAVGNCLELNDEFISRYCGEGVKEQLLRVEESDRGYLLSSHLGEGSFGSGLDSLSDNDITLPHSEIEHQFEGEASDYFENPDDFTINGNLAYLYTGYGFSIDVDVPALRDEIDEFLAD